MSNLEDDFIKMWLMGFLFLLGLSILLGILYYNANSIVNAAYDGSDIVLRVIK